MNKKETKEVYETLYNAYRGTLFASRRFADGTRAYIKYEFNSPELQRLNDKYNVKEKTGNGGDFHKARKLVKWLTPIPHDGMFSLKKHDFEINAPALLKYASTGNGLNCACKAKILQECCLAINIYARRVALYPASPYDDDNHVVTEIYDRALDKWIMLDPTAGGSFYDDKQTPLNCMEARELFAEGRRVYFAKAGQNPDNADALFEKNFYWNMYFAKNLYRFEFEEVSAFGIKGGERLNVVPEGYDIAKAKRKNYEYKIDAFMKENTPEYIPTIEKMIDELNGRKHIIVSPLTLTRAPF